MTNPSHCSLKCSGEQKEIYKPHLGLGNNETSSDGLVVVEKNFGAESDLYKDEVCSHCQNDEIK